jgi:D-lactate dehydrogenase
MNSFGCKPLAYDVYQNPACLDMGMEYVDLPDLLARSNIISLHCPLLPATQYLINAESLKLLQPDTMLINTSRGGPVDTRAVIDALKSGQLGYFGTDVYEEEENLFFEDLSGTVIQDDPFQLLQSFLIVTGDDFLTHSGDAIAHQRVQRVVRFPISQPITPVQRPSY